MATSTSSNWKVPTSDDVQTLLSSIVTGAANEEDSGGTPRLDKLVPIIVDEIRGAIDSAGITPLSATPDSVPPEGFRPCLFLVLEMLVGSTPQMGQFVQTDWLSKNIDLARKWMQAIRDGLQVTYPSDPDPNFQTDVDWGDFTGLELQQVQFVFVNAAGTGYSLNDLLTIVGGTGTSGQLSVTSLGTGGAVKTVSITTLGGYLNQPPTVGVPVTGGTGTGATFNLILNAVGGQVDMTTDGI